MKKQAGFGKDGEKGFDGSITNLMMQIYLCNCDFKKRVNKRGIEYGWDVAVYSSIEHIYGYDYVTSCYKDNPQDSWKQLVQELYQICEEQSIKLCSVEDLNDREQGIRFDDFLCMDAFRMGIKSKDDLRRYSLEELEKMCPKDKRLFVRLKKLKTIQE